jgi:hypothetical protein
MPICLVHHKKGRLPDNMLSKLGLAISKSVAAALDVPLNPNLHLTPNEVEVRFTESGPYDIVHHDIGIMIFGNGGPDREDTLKSRAMKIRDDLMAFVANYDRNLTGYVYVMLQKAEYYEIDWSDGT